VPRLLGLTALFAQLLLKRLDFLGLGEPVEMNDAVNNPWSEEPADNWSPPGTKYINGELVLIRELMEVTSGSYII